MCTFDQTHCGTACQLLHIFFCYSSLTLLRGMVFGKRYDQLGLIFAKRYEDKSLYNFVCHPEVLLAQGRDHLALFLPIALHLVLLLQVLVLLAILLSFLW